MVEPYLNLKGRAGEAMDFYEAVFGGQDKIATRFADLPEDPENPRPEAEKQMILYGMLNIRGTTMHFSDMQPDDLSDLSMISLMVKFDEEDEMAGVYHALLDGGKALMELADADFAKKFAWVKDKFGIDWQLMLE